MAIFGLWVRVPSLLVNGCRNIAYVGHQQGWRPCVPKKLCRSVYGRRIVHCAHFYGRWSGPADIQ